MQYNLLIFMARRERSECERVYHWSYYGLLFSISQDLKSLVSGDLVGVGYLGISSFTVMYEANIHLRSPLEGIGRL